VEPLSIGDLVRWIVDYKFFEAPPDGLVLPSDPIWAYGIIIEVSEIDPMSVVLVRLDTKTYQILHMIHDGFEIVSKISGEENG